MTTQYNAMATVPISTTTVINEKIQKTSDCFQVTFTTAPDLTPIWRTVIKRRYFDGLNESKYFHSTWADYARINGKRVLIDASKVNDYDLFQSTLQVYLTTGPDDKKRQDKLLTVHIYHTNGKKSVRTVLVQGFRCPQWVESEFEAIKRCVHGIALLYTSQSCMLKAALTANIQKALMPPGEEAPAVSSSDRTPGNTDALPISPSSSHDNGAEPMTTITPSSSSDAQRELETTHISSSSKDVMRELVTSSPSSDTLGMLMNTTPSSPLYNAREKEDTTPILSPSVDARGDEETTPTLSPSVDARAEEETTPTLSPSAEARAEEETTPTLSPFVEARAEEETTPTLSPSVEAPGEEETTPTLSPSVEARAEEETNPTLSPSVKARAEEETTPTLSPSVEAPGEEETTPTLSPSVEARAEEETTPTLSPSVEARAEEETTPTLSPSVEAPGEEETTPTLSPSVEAPGEEETTPTLSPSVEAPGEEETTPTLSPFVEAPGEEETTPTLSPSVEAPGEEEITPTLESPSDNVHREQENTPTLSPSDDDLREQEMNCTIEQLRAELVAVKASQEADREHFKIEINSLNVIINSMKSTIQEMEAKFKLNKDRKQCNNCQLKQVAPHTSTTSATSKPQAVDRVWQETPKTGSQHPTNSNTKNNSSKPSNSRDEHHHRSNKDQCLTISPDTTLLYIGDSVLDGLHAEKMGCSERDHAQVTISPGLTVTSLISSLSSRVQQSKKVTCVNVHVGINDCVNGRFIKKETWTSVISALRRCFPSAAVNLSSILPLNDTNKHVANCINKTNDGMYHAAWEKGAFFTDNDETFYSRSWEVKSSWYLNGFRPNKRGSSGLARNLKRTVRLSRHRPSEKSSQQRPTTYQPTPAYVSYVPKDYRSHQRAHKSPPPHHQHGHPTTASNSPVHHTSPANNQDRRTYSDVVSYGSAKTHPSQAHPEAYDQSRVTSQIQNQQTASLMKQPHLATPPIQQMYLSMVEKLIEFGKILHVQ